MVVLAHKFRFLPLHPSKKIRGRSFYNLILLILAQAHKAIKLSVHLVIIVIKDPHS